MTHNQIDYWNLVENRRHNRATESLTGQDVAIRGGTLTELQRHNIASENISYASINQADLASQRAAAATRYSSDVASAASRYAADTSAATQRYSAQLNAETQRYNVDQQTSAQNYNTNVMSAAQRYGADKQSENVQHQVEATKRGQDVQAGVAGLNVMTDLTKTWWKSQTDPLTSLTRGIPNLLGGD